MAETIESLKAQVSAFMAENLALKAQLTAYYNTNCALGHQNAQLREVGMTAAQVSDRNTFLEEQVVRLEDALVVSEKKLVDALTDTERVRQEVLSALRKLPQRR
jgi:regulator of replication initiation timing